MQKTLIFFSMVFILLGCTATSRVAELKEIGNRGWYTTVGSVAEFHPKHKSVAIWTPEGKAKAPVIIYAHGGAGFREDDSTRVEMMRRNGFATISFDAYEMNGLDWNFVTKRVTNNGKQNLIWGVFKGALQFVLKKEKLWDTDNIFFYGASNGGRTVLYAGNKLPSKNIRGIVSEAPAATGYALDDIAIPTIVLYGEKDNWAGKSETDYVWTRTYPSSPISIADWGKSQNEQDHPVKFIFYKDAGHLLFEGPLEKVTVKRGDKIAFTAYQGASKETLELYEQDVITFIKNNLVQK